MGLAPLVVSFHNEKDVAVFKAGEKIFAEGETSEFMFGVVEGKVDIVRNGVVLETVEQGGIFGELCLVIGYPRAVDAVARTDCRLAKINSKRFLFLVQETPYFALEVMQVMADRMRRMISVLPI